MFSIIGKSFDSAESHVLIGDILCTSSTSIIVELDEFQTLEKFESPRGILIYCHFLETRLGSHPSVVIVIIH